MIERIRPIHPLCLLLCIQALAGVASCGTSHVDDSTETGNPPLRGPEIDPARVALVVSGDEVRVVGEPGAVTPGGAEVEIEIVGTGEVISATADEDGSFDVEVDADPEDAFEVRAVDGTDSSPPVYVVRSGAAVGDAEGGGLTCDQRRDLASGQIERAAEEADKSCSSSLDCMVQGLSITCYQCGYALVSAAGRSEIRATLDALERGLCANFVYGGRVADDGDACIEVAQPCVPPPGTDVLACIDGTCELLDGPPDSSCSTCLDDEVSWGITNIPVELGDDLDDDRYSVSGCGRFELRTRGGTSCESDVPLCDGDAWTVQDLLSALEQPEVQAALDSDEYFGRVPGPDEPYFSITVGDATIEIGQDCDSGDDCNPVPAEVAALRERLDELAAQQACIPELCQMPFDSGMGEADLLVYAYEQTARTCVPRSYGGGGGNDNRFDSLQECWASCPPARPVQGCPAGREFREEVCVVGGLAGGCDEQAPACARPCSAASECAGDPIGSWCDNGVCDALSPE